MTAFLVATGSVLLAILSIFFAALGIKFWRDFDHDRRIRRAVFDVPTEGDKP